MPCPLQSLSDDTSSAEGGPFAVSCHTNYQSYPFNSRFYTFLVLYIFQALEELKGALSHQIPGIHILNDQD